MLHFKIIICHKGRYLQVKISKENRVFEYLFCCLLKDRKKIFKLCGWFFLAIPTVKKIKKFKKPGVYVREIKGCKLCLYFHSKRISWFLLENTCVKLVFITHFPSDSVGGIALSLHQFSSNIFHTSSRAKVMRIEKMITKGEMLWSSSKVSQLTLKENVWRSVERICRWLCQ